MTVFIYYKTLTLTTLWQLFSKTTINLPCQVFAVITQSNVPVLLLMFDFRANVLEANVFQLLGFPFFAIFASHPSCMYDLSMFVC